MIDPVVRCQQLSVRFENIAIRFAKLPDIAQEDLNILDAILKQIEGNKENPINTYLLESWLSARNV